MAHELEMKNGRPHPKQEDPDNEEEGEEGAGS